MILYHEISNDSLESVLQNGLKRTDRGEKGSDQDIIRTDHYLDRNIPSKLRKIGLSRSKNIYAFIGDTDTIIDIKNGAIVPLKKYKDGCSSTLLQLKIGATHAYVSDLDKYDAVKSALLNYGESQARSFAQEYWNSITDFGTFQPGSIARPEVMIVKDLPPNEISIHRYMHSL